MTRCSGLTARDLDHRLAEIAGQQLQPAARRERLLRPAPAPWGCRTAPATGAKLELVLDQLRLDGIARQPAAPDGLDVLVQMAALEQFADQEPHSTGGVEMVHVGDAVGIDAGEQRHDFAEIGHVLPGHLQPGGGGDRDQVDGVVGRAARRVQADEPVDDGLFGDHVADRRVVVALRGERQRALGRLAGQRFAQRRARIDEARARQMQAHDLHQHLVGVGRAVEGAGAGRMVGLRLGLEQFGAADLAFGIELADAALLVVRHARGHRARRGRTPPADGRTSARRSAGPARSCRRCPETPRRRTCCG